jgi:general secretion pathway protein G
MTINSKLSRDDCKRHRGFTLVELMIGVVIIGIIGAIATMVFQLFAEKARIKKAASEIASIQTEIKIFETTSGSLPASLADINKGNFLDPWGNTYRYSNFNIVPTSEWRRDKNLHPLNVDYDLWSNGKDGLTHKNLTIVESHDEIIRANDGAYIGLGSEY